MTAVTPTDRPKSVRNRCVIEVFGGVFLCCHDVFWILCGCIGVCHFMNIKSNCYTRKIWQYDTADFDLFRQKLQDCNWNIINKNIDNQIDFIAENFTQSTEKSISNKIVSIRPRDLPLFHNGIWRSIRKRNRLHGIAKRLNNPDNWQRFREARNKVASEICTAIVNYFKKLATNLHQWNSSAKQWWKVAKRFLKNSNDSEIPLLIHNNSQYSAPAEKASLLNSYFC